MTDAFATLQHLQQTTVPTTLIPNIISAIGLSNTVLTFVLTNILQRRSMIRWRRLAWLSLTALWASILFCFLDLLHANTIANISSFGVKAGIALWSVSLLGILFLVYSIFSTTTTAPTKALLGGFHFRQKLRPFQCDNIPIFGIPFLDLLLNPALLIGGRIYFPILVFSDRNACGLTAGQRFLASGLMQGEGAVYLAFTRPATIVASQVATSITSHSASWISRLVVIDCYTDLYLPDATLTVGAPPSSVSVENCDPRNPTEVQTTLTKALTQLQKRGINKVRVLYDSLSDFLSIADQELVVSYLRRSIVWEEMFGVKSFYLLWPHLIAEPLSDEYLCWFGNSTLRLLDKGGYVHAILEGLESRPISCTINAQMEIIDMIQFTIDDLRAKELADILQRLSYLPDDMTHITPFAGDAYREMHFIFFLTAIDHNTHGVRRYEALVEGQTMHGSDLMYYQARRAALINKDLFLPATMAKVSNEQIKSIFTIPDVGAPTNMPERTRLLVDAGKRLLQIYSSDLANVFQKANCYLRRSNGPSILELLREFQAYSDPLEKKSFLLVKLLRRRGLLKIEDPENLAVPVDHVLFTIALRSGLVKANDEAHKALLERTPLDEGALTELRAVTRKAYQRVSTISGISPDAFDDLLWAYGREYLRVSAPFGEYYTEIKASLGGMVRNREVLIEFLRFINGVDNTTCGNSSQYPIPTFPATLFF